MSTKSASLLIVISLIGFGAILFVLTSEKDADQTVGNSDQNNPSQVNIQTVEEKIYTLAEVEKHNNKNDCWTIINDSVYDLTSYIPRHSGGDEILIACGVDGTTLFTSRTDSDGEKVGSGTPHSSSAQQQLRELKIGTLSQ